YRTKEALKRAGVESIRTHVFCVDRTYWSSDLAKPDPPYLTLYDQATTAFCASIVDAMASIPRPYNIDWPLFRNVRIPLRDIHTVSSITDWETYDLTSSPQKDDGLFALTSIPSDVVMQQLDGSLGWAISKHSQLCKVRVYARPIGGIRPAFLCQLLPVVALDPLDITVLEELWTSLLVISGASKSFSASFVSHTSRLRLLQYIAAAHLGRLWLNAVKHSLSIHLE